MIGHSHSDLVFVKIAINKYHLISSNNLFCQSFRSLVFNL